MNALPPLTDAILVALAELVADAQTERRDPSHEQISFLIKRSGLSEADPLVQGQRAGKAKRVRAVLSQALETNLAAGQQFAALFIGHIKGHGGFRPNSANYVGNEAIQNLQAAFSSEGFLLSSDGELTPTILDILTAAELTTALQQYVQRARKGVEDAALLTGTGKDLLEATAAHVVCQIWNNYNPHDNFPTLLGQAFVAVDLKTSANKPEPGETPQHRLQRALYDAACAVNTLRNKQGTGHGRPWLPTVTEGEAHAAVQTMGIVADMLLCALKAKKP